MRISSVRLLPRLEGLHGAERNELPFAQLSLVSFEELEVRVGELARGGAPLDRIAIGGSVVGIGVSCGVALQLAALSFARY